MLIKHIARQAMFLALGLVLPVAFHCTKSGDTAGSDDTNNPATATLTGTFDTEYGLMVLTQTGDSVSGHYEFRNGNIAGTVDDTIFTAMWWEGVSWSSPFDSAPPEKRGPARFVIRSTGDSLTGRWRFEADSVWSETIWWAERISDSADYSLLQDDSGNRNIDTTALLRYDFSGTWNNGADMMAIVAGDSVYIFYGDPYGYFAGTIDGHLISGQWWEVGEKGTTYADATFRGDAEFVVSMDEDSIFGRWRYEGNVEWEQEQWDAAKLSDDADTAALWTDTTATPITLMPTGIYLPAAQGGELLFFVSGKDSSQYFYYGEALPDSLDITHVMIRDSSGGTATVFFDNYLPVQWIFDSISAAVYNFEETGAYDPTAAFHAIKRPGGEDSLTVDIYPHDLSAILDGVETEAGVDMQDIRQYLQDSLISTFEELVTRANSSGQRHYIAADDACALGAAAAALALSQAAGGLPKRTVLTPGLFRYFVTVAASWISNMILDELTSDAPPNPAALNALLCEGASSWVICHYMFYPYDMPIECATYCLTSTRCFSTICMPTEITVQSVRNFRSGKLYF